SATSIAFITSSLVHKATSPITSFISAGLITFFTSDVFFHFPPTKYFPEIFGYTSTIRVIPPILYFFRLKCFCSSWWALKRFSHWTYTFHINYYHRRLSSVYSSF